MTSCQSEPEGHSSAWRSGDFGGSVLLEETLLTGCLFTFLTTVLAPRAWAPDAGGGGHQHFVKFHMKVSARVFREAQFTHVIKTHTSRRWVPWRGEEMLSGLCSPLEEEGV